MQVFYGNATNTSIAIGKLTLTPPIKPLRIFRKTIKETEHETGWNLLENAKYKVQDLLFTKLSRLNKNADKAQKEILEAHLLMLNDAVFLQEIKEEYYNNLLNIDYIVDKKVKEYGNKLKKSQNPYLAARASDIKTVFNSLLKTMKNIPLSALSFPSTLPLNSIIVARSLEVEDIFDLKERKVAGIVLEEGGTFSHIVILARAYNIPILTGISYKEIEKEEKEVRGRLAVLDSKKGILFLSPDDKTITHYKMLLKQEQINEEEYKKFIDCPALSSDKTEYKLCANISSPMDVPLVIKNGAAAIGLFRTELLYLNKNTKEKFALQSLYDEEAQFNIYRETLTAMKGKVVTIRLFDIGGDKKLAKSELKLVKEENALLGLRGVRLLLHYPEILKTQLHALYRASPYGKLQVLIPLVTTEKEVISVLRVIKEVRERLALEGIKTEDIPVGVMIETPAAALIADRLSKVSSFFSLGTNDLIQYSLCVDRENHKVSSYYDFTNLAVLRLIKHTLEVANKNNLPVTVCGEAAGQFDLFTILSGLGAKSFSMSAALIPIIKSQLTHISCKEMEAAAKKLLEEGGSGFPL